MKTGCPDSSVGLEKVYICGDPKLAGGSNIDAINPNLASAARRLEWELQSVPSQPTITESRDHSGLQLGRSNLHCPRRLVCRSPPATTSGQVIQRLTSSSNREVASVNKTLTGKMFLLKNNPHAKRNTCQDTEMKEFSADIARYRAMGDHGKDLWMNPAVWAIACYRFGNWLNVAKPVLIIRFPLKIVAYLANKFCEVFMEMCIDASATIGGDSI